jgi:hypothetical protein
MQAPNGSNSPFKRHQLADVPDKTIIKTSSSFLQRRTKLFSIGVSAA